METILLHLPPQSYKALQERAHRAGKSLESFTCELLEQALGQARGSAKTPREILEGTGRIRPLGEALRRRIIPGVSLEDVQNTLARADGPALSELILQQRGPKA